MHICICMHIYVYRHTHPVLECIHVRICISTYTGSHNSTMPNLQVGWVHPIEVTWASQRLGQAVEVTPTDDSCLNISLYTYTHIHSVMDVMYETCALALTQLNHGCPSPTDPLFHGLTEYVHTQRCKATPALILAAQGSTTGLAAQCSHMQTQMYTFTPPFTPSLTAYLYIYIYTYTWSFTYI